MISDSDCLHEDDKLPYPRLETLKVEVRDVRGKRDIKKKKKEEDGDEMAGLGQLCFHSSAVHSLIAMTGPKWVSLVSIVYSL